MTVAQVDGLQENQEIPPFVYELVHNRDAIELKKVLKDLPAFQIAELISKQKKEGQLFVFTLLDLSLAVDVFGFLSPRTQKRILCSISKTRSAALLNALTPDDRTEFLQDMPRAVINDLIKFLPLEERKQTLMLLGYPEGSVGRLMTPDYISIRADWTIQKVLDHLLEYGHDSETISHLFVVDGQNKLLDDIRLRDFLFVPRARKVESIMDRQFVALEVDNDDDTAISTFRRFDRTALPVIDQKGKLLGIVTVDDVLRLSDKEATKEIQKIGGQEALDEPYMETPFLQLMKKRAGWLTILFLGEMLTATAMGYFEYEISKAVVLALFLPLIISSGGNAGGQATTLIIRAMALEEVKLRDWWKVIRRELAAGLFLGLVLGAIGFARVAVWSQFSNIYGEHWFLISLTIFSALIGVILWGTLAGAALPMVLRALGIDPATSSAPFVATLVDVCGVVIYFLVALFILSGTLL